MAVLRVARFNYGPDLPSPVAGTFSHLILPSGRKMKTVERSWVGNKPSESCIPEGVYKLVKRRSGVVERSTGGEFIEGWEITGVPERTFIMIHPGNWPHDLEGCLATGLSYGLIKDRNGIARLGVGSSMVAFRLLMEELEGGTNHEIHIMPHLVSYP